MTGPLNGKSAPWWVHAIAVVGLPGALALMLVGERLGMIPGLRSQAEIANERLTRMEQILREEAAVIRWTCHAMWVHTNGDDKMAKLCYSGWDDADRRARGWKDLP